MRPCPQTTAWLDALERDVRLGHRTLASVLLEVYSEGIARGERRGRNFADLSSAVDVLRAHNDSIEHA